MKKLSMIIAALVLMGTVFTTQAQAPYKHSIGGMVGSMEAFSYKTFPTNHFAIQLDLGYKMTYTAGEHLSNVNLYDGELNANFMYEGNFTKGLYGFAGGGVSMGYNWNFVSVHSDWFGTYHSNNGKFGLNAILGLELKISAPVTFQWDFRPGYGLLFNGNNWTWNYFDWGLNFGVRYTF